MGENNGCNIAICCNINNRIPGNGAAFDIVLIRAYRGQHWKGKQKKKFAEKIEGSSNGNRLKNSKSIYLLYKWLVIVYFLTQCNESFDLASQPFSVAPSFWKNVLFPWEYRAKVKQHLVGDLPSALIVYQGPWPKTEDKAVKTN